MAERFYDITRYEVGGLIVIVSETVGIYDPVTKATKPFGDGEGFTREQLLALPGDGAYALSQWEMKDDTLFEEGERRVLAGVHLEHLARVVVEGDPHATAFLDRHSDEIAEVTRASVEGRASATEQKLEA